MNRLPAPGTTPSVWRTARAGLAAALLAIVILAAGCARDEAVRDDQADASADSRAVPVRVATAVQTDMETELKVTGTTRATKQADVVAEVSGKVDRVYVDVGDYVKRGATLLTVDREIAAAQRRQASAGVQNARAALHQAREVLEVTEETTASSVRQAEAGVQSAEERLAQAKASARLVESQVESAIEQARNGVRTAEARLEEICVGAREQERRQAEANVRQAKAALDHAERTYERQQRLLDAGVCSQQVCDQARTEYEVAQANYQKAAEQLSLVEEGARSQEVRIAEVAVDQAKEQLAQAQASRTQIEVAQQEVRAAEASVRQAREQLTSAIANRGQIEVQRRQVESAQTGVQQARAGEEIASVRLRKHAVVAPISGTVSARLANPGEGVSPGLPLISLVSNDMLYLEGRVSEDDLPELYAGQAAAVTVDAAPDEIFKGEIIAVAPDVDDESRTGTVRVRLLNPGGVVRAGMFARAVIVTERHEDAVVVDRDAILTEGEAAFVYVVDGDVARRREITTGLQTETRAEVVSGLTVGERVVIQGQDQLQDETRVRIADDSPTAEGDAQ